MSKMKHLAYTGGWKKMEPLWGLIINSGALNKMLPILEAILAKVSGDGGEKEVPQLAVEAISN